MTKTQAIRQEALDRMEGLTDEGAERLGASINALTRAVGDLVHELRNSRQADEWMPKRTEVG